MLHLHLRRLERRGCSVFRFSVEQKLPPDQFEPHEGNCFEKVMVRLPEHFGISRAEVRAFKLVMEILTSAFELSARDPRRRM